jgi:hypothetical protein
MTSHLPTQIGGRNEVALVENCKPMRIIQGGLNNGQDVCNYEEW